MPDFGLFFIVFLSLVGCICAACEMRNEPGWFFGALFFGAIAALSIWWWVTAYATLQATAIYRPIETFGIQTITTDDGSKYQIYIDYDTGTIHNITRRWYRIVPDGTMLVRSERQDHWFGGIRFFMPSKTKDELRLPFDCRWDGFLSGEPQEPIVRFENVN